MQILTSTLIQIFFCYISFSFPLPWNYLGCGLRITVGLHKCLFMCSFPQNKGIHRLSVQNIIQASLCSLKLLGALTANYLVCTHVHSIFSHYLLKFSVCLAYYRQCKSFHWGLIFVGKQHIWKLNPQKFVHTKN